MPRSDVVKMPSDNLGEGTWGPGHVSVLNRLPAAEIHAAEMQLTWSGRTIGEGIAARDELAVTGCHLVHYRLTVRVGEDSIKKIVFGHSDWLVLRRNVDGKLMLRDRRKLQAFFRE